MAHHYPRALEFRECYGRLRTILPNHILYRRHLAGRPAAVWGNRHCFPGRAPRELARGAVIDTAPIVLFILGGFIVRIIPLLAKPASDLLDNMYHARVPITPTMLFINGVGEELFFRDVVRRQLADALHHPAILTQLALYIAVTAAMSIPLLLIASILIGGTAALEARADGFISATTLHLVWSIGMAFCCPWLCELVGYSKLINSPVYPRTKSLVQCTLQLNNLLR